MFPVLRSSWPLFLGMLLLMVGNGMQGTLLGIRGAIEGFSTSQMSLVMSAYFAGFLGGSRLTPQLIRRVGHVRVFAALGSLISAALVLFPILTEPWAWVLFRAVLGFCFCGVYITAESWLNDAATNDTRGQALSLYIIVQMLGVISAQYLLVLGDPAGFVLFIVPSVLVSLSFTPILLAASPVPAFETSKPMSLREIYGISPLGCVGMFLMGGVFAGMFGMSAVFGTAAGFSLAQVSTFVASFYVGGLLAQYPIGWLSDRLDRRRIILGCGVLGAVAALGAILAGGVFPLLLVAGVVVGGVANPLYALLIAYTNDYLEPEDMPAASAGLLFIHGVGAILGPIAIGQAMGVLGPAGFFGLLALLLGLLAGYALWRMTQRAAPEAHEAGTIAPILATASPVAVEVAQEVYIESAADHADDATLANE